jgi:hypothetical protein
MAAKVPTTATGTANSGITAARQSPKKTRMTKATRTTASSRVRNTSLIDSSMKGEVS